tara:strand:+ start:496 stop:606 length:111 start_codon:yes stop_codon:yes gene_type:complete
MVLELLPSAPADLEVYDGAIIGEEWICGILESRSHQ